MVDDDLFVEEFPTIPPSLLTTNQRDVIYLRYVMGMTFEQIAKETGRMREAVIRTHGQALRRVEKYISTSLFAAKLSPPVL